MIYIFSFLESNKEIEEIKQANAPMTKGLN